IVRAGFLTLAPASASTAQPRSSTMTRWACRLPPSPVAGGDVILSNLDNTHNSFVASAAFGRFLTDNLYVKDSYRNFGRSAASGFGAFGPANFQQIQATTASGAFLGLGFIYDLSERFYFDASAEIGASFVRSGGVHDANLFPQPFP